MTIDAVPGGLFSDSVDYVLGVPQAQVQRSELDVRDVASIDQIQGSLTEAFQILSLPDQTDAAAAGLATLTVVLARAHSLLNAHMISSQTLHAVEHCVQEVRMALVGVLV